MTTLLRALIDATGLSRRRAFAAIREGQVAVSNALVVDPSSEYAGGPISLEGIELRPSRRSDVYLLLNKPPGFVTTRSDELGRPTVFDLVPTELHATGLHPVGRLDRETSGLLILTNDGDLTQRLTHPSHEVAKEYWVGLARPPTSAQLRALEEGTELDGRLRRPLALELLQGAPGFDVLLTIGEGRKRQVRRMFEAVDARVVRLRRVREGPLSLGRLPEGEIRTLTRDEVSALMGG